MANSNSVLGALVQANKEKGEKQEVVKHQTKKCSVWVPVKEDK